MNLLAYFALVLFTSSQISNQLLEVKMPAGFEILPYADDSLASDIYCLSISPKGDVMVSGKGIPFSPGVIIVNWLGPGSRAGGSAVNSILRAGTTVGFLCIGTVFGFAKLS